MILRIASFACLGGFLYGYDLGLISGALSPIQDELKASKVATEIMVGAAKFGAIFGTFLGGALMLHYGRRLTIGLDSLFFFLGPVIMAFSASIIGLTAGRLLIGLGIGVSAVVVPAYLGEVAPAKMRGRIVEVYEVMLCLGMLSAMLVDAALQHVPWNWRWMVGAPVVPAMFLALALVILPESPRWLVVNARLDEALAVIHRLYTDRRLPAGAQTSTAEVEQELMELWSAVEKDKAAARERCLQVQRHARPNKLHNAWRHLDLRRGRWHTLQDAAPGGPTSDVGHYPASQAGIDRPSEETAGAQPLSPDVTEDAAVALLPKMNGGIHYSDNAQNSPFAEEENLPGQSNLYPSEPFTSEPAEERQASGGSASTSEGTPLKQLRVGTVSDPELTEIMQAPVHEALQDPQSPLYRSLSKIPNGLPPVRTKSDLDDSRDATPQSAQQAPRKGPMESGWPPKGSFLAGDRPARSGGDGFWKVFWDMLLDIKAVASGKESEAFRIALWLAFFNQAMASSAIINYAPQLLEESGISNRTAATLLTCSVTGAKISGVIMGLVFIDSLGRRPLLIWGSAACSMAMLLLFGGVYMLSTTFEVLAMCIFMLAFNCSYAGVFWVLLSELFSMSAKSPAASAATAMLFLAGFLADSLFLSLLDWFGAYSFLLFSAIAACGGIYSYARVPETKGRTLAEVQALLKGESSLGEVPFVEREGPPRLSPQALPREGLPRPTSVQIQ